MTSTTTSTKIEKSQRSISSIRTQTWSGEIPVVLSLAPSSLSSPAMPPPLHRMLPRMTFLHLGLREEIHRFYKYAPTLTILQGIAGTSLNSVSKTTYESSKRVVGVNKSDNIENDDSNVNPLQSSKQTDDGSNKNEKTTTSSHFQNDNVGDDPFHHSDHNDIPICWFEDEVTGKALRWHIFSGVLYDLMKHRHHEMSNNLKVKETPSVNTSPNPLPWKIRIHFTSYPSSILSLEQYTSPPQPNPSISMNNKQNSNSNKADFNISRAVPIMKIIQQTYSNSLKQSLFLQHGSSKVAMNMSKHSHVKLWDALMTNRCEDFWEVSQDLMLSNSPKIDSTPGDEKTLVHIPVRILVDGKPHIQRPCKLETIQANIQMDEGKKILISAWHYFTLGRLLSDWLPSYFSIANTSSNFNTDQNDLHYETKKNDQNESIVKWDIQGIQPSLSIPVADLWLALCHPDQFLYITVTTLNSL